MLHQDEGIGASIHTVLVVDDDPVTLAETKSALEQKYEVKTAKDGGQAYSAIQMHAPDIVILKLILPGESGFEICERIKQHEEFKPVLILTEIDLESSRTLASRVGADGYMTRPFDPSDLHEIVKEVCDIVFERSQADGDAEKGAIRFRCSCGQKIKERYENRGRYVNCPSCNDRNRVPQRSVTEFIEKRSDNAGEGAKGQTEPLKFVTVKCKHCNTFYRLFTGSVDDAKTCPRCKKVQTGSLSIVGAPLSRAALASSLRVLRIRGGKNHGKKLLIPDREVVLGAGASCDIRNASKGVGDRHCSLTPGFDGMKIKPLDAKHPTLIDGETLKEETILRPGSRLQIGILSFELVGQDRDIDEEQAKVQRWQKEEEEAKKRGVKVYNENKSIPAEAAEVIQQHWDITRKRAAMAGTQS